jgi:hypothetical protein
MYTMSLSPGTGKHIITTNKKLKAAMQSNNRNDLNGHFLFQKIHRQFL